MEVDQRLQQVAPEWFKRFKRARGVTSLMTKKDVQLGPTTQTLDLSKYESCMVGEAFYFSRDYNPNTFDSHANQCKKCTSISERITWGPKHSWMSNAVKYHLKVIKEFCIHLEKDHGVEFNGD